MSVRWRALRSLVAVAAFAVPIGAEAGENAGHSLADKFAHESSGATHAGADADALRQKLEAEERLKADEAEMLERAKAEAAERRKASDADDDKAARDRAVREKARIKQAAEKLRLAHEKDDADRRTADAKRLAEETAAKAAADAEKARLAAKAEAERRVAEAEQRRLAEERAAAERKKAAEAEKARLAEVAEAERRAQEAEKLRLAREAEEAERNRVAAAKADAERRAGEEAHRRIEEAARADAQRRMEAEREDEARRLSEKLARAREQREAAKTLGPGYSALGNPPLRTDDVVASRQVSNSAEARDIVRATANDEPKATLLLVLKPGSRGIRRYEKTADPIVCLGDACYVGSGADVAAAKLTRGRALGPGNTLGQRAGACRHSLTCIFREVDVSAGRFEVQPIDLRLLRHDRRETVATEADRTCTVSSGRLRCGRPVEAGSYRIWVVPESVARRAGVNALWSAVADGLPSSTTADLDR